jgi:hypothetical protein
LFFLWGGGGGGERQEGSIRAGQYTFLPVHCILYTLLSTSRPIPLTDKSGSSVFYLLIIAMLGSEVYAKRK